MIRYRYALLVAALTMVAFAILPACSDAPGSGADEVGRRDIGNPDAGGDGSSDVIPDAPFVEGGRLEFVSEQIQDVEYGTVRELEVRYVDGDGNPVPDAPLSFDYDPLFAADSIVSPQLTFTDSDGIAATSLRAGEERAAFDIEVSVSGDDSVDPIDFQINVSPKDTVDYVVRFINGTPFESLDAKYFVYNGTERTCAELAAYADDPLFPSPDSAFLSDDTQSNGDGSFDDVFLPPLRGEQFPLTYAIGFVFVEGRAVGYACTELPTDIELGASAVIELPIAPVWPEVDGSYRVYNTFDLVDALPDSVEQYVRYLGNFFISPGATVSQILADNWSDYASLPGWVQTTVAELIDEALEAFLPESISNVFDVGGDIYVGLTEFHFNGSLIIDGEPDANGRLDGDNLLELYEVEFEFQTIDFAGVDLRNYGYNAARGDWTGAVGFSDVGINYTLAIESFGLEVQYGEILAFVLERFVFPAIIDPGPGEPPVDSLEDFVGWLIDCESIANGIGNATFAGIVQSVCDGATAGLGALLRDQLTNLSGDTSSFFQLQTPADQACPLFDTDTPFDNEIDRIGEEADQCIWQGTVRFDQNNPTGDDLNGTFYAR